MDKEQNDEDGKYLLYKVVVIGDSSVGKTCIWSRFTRNEFISNSKPTIGVDFGHGEVTLDDGTKVKVQIWDTAGQDRFRALTKGYYRGACAALIVYDVTKAPSFKNVEKWLSELQSNVTDKQIVKMLVGNKSDLKTDREVSTEDARQFSKQHELLFIETSALDGSNIKEAFQQLVQAAHELQKSQPPPPSEPKTTVNPQAKQQSEPPKKGCC